MRIWEIINGVCHLAVGILEFLHGYPGPILTIENGIAIAFVGIGVCILRRVLRG